MASMTGLALPSSSGDSRPPADGHNEEQQLFGGLVVSNPMIRRRWYGWPVSIAAHLVTFMLVVLVPILWPSPSPEHPDYIRLLWYNPPPAAAAPLPKGDPNIVKLDRAKPVTPDPNHQKPQLTVEIPKEERELKPEARAHESEQAGSLTGDDSGIPEGMEGGIPGGVPGGVPNGVPGGCVGCTGDNPVYDYDQGPKLIKMVKPDPYPQEAFVKKVEGTVVLEILIDVTGHVAQARVIRSIPSLDEAAVVTVKQWLFSPAVKQGRPVPTVAQATVTFRIY